MACITNTICSSECGELPVKQRGQKSPEDNLSARSKSAALGTTEDCFKILKSHLGQFLLRVSLNFVAKGITTLAAVTVLIALLVVVGGLFMFVLSTTGNSTSTST